MNDARTTEPNGARERHLLPCSDAWGLYLTQTVILILTGQGPWIGISEGSRLDHGCLDDNQQKGDR